MNNNITQTDKGFSVEQELLPCPFCGNKPELFPLTRDRAKWVIVCENPFCIMNCGDTVRIVKGEVKIVTDMLPTEEEAVKAWNTRKE